MGKFKIQIVAHSWNRLSYKSTKYVNERHHFYYAVTVLFFKDVSWFWPFIAFNKNNKNNNRKKRKNNQNLRFSLRPMPNTGPDRKSPSYIIHYYIINIFNNTISIIAQLVVYSLYIIIHYYIIYIYILIHYYIFYK